MTQDVRFTSIGIISPSKWRLDPLSQLMKRTESGATSRSLDLGWNSKSKRDLERGFFFSRIMVFPNPRPVNIEKDAKVFDWKGLGSALERSSPSTYVASLFDSKEKHPLISYQCSQSYLGINVVPSIESVPMNSLLPMDSSPSPTPYFPTTHLGCGPGQLHTPSFDSLSNP